MNPLLPSSVTLLHLNMEVAGSSEMSALVFQSARRNIPERNNLDTAMRTPTRYVASVPPLPAVLSFFLLARNFVLHF
jgi:hypothetical protein